MRRLQFQSPPGGGHAKRRLLLRSALRLANYLIVSCVAVILLHILFQGARALLQPEAPFVNVSFFVEAPQTLHVFEPLELVAQREAMEARLSDVKALAPGERDALKNKLEALHGTIATQAIMMSDTELRAATDRPAADTHQHRTFAYSGGGIGPAIVGTFLLMAGAIGIALPLGIPASVYLSEYSRPGKTLASLRAAISYLAGVPSIIFGLFGFGVFVLLFGWGVSLLAGWFTLAIMILPSVITSGEAALCSVPGSYREGALALGATRWKTIRTNVLPYALPKILAASMLHLARVAGEAAPILFTVAYAFREDLPWETLDKWHEFFFQGVMALPYHIYVVSVKLPHNRYTETMQYGSALVFLCLVGGLALSGIALRHRLSHRPAGAPSGPLED